MFAAKVAEVVGTCTSAVLCAVFRFVVVVAVQLAHLAQVCWHFVCACLLLLISLLSLLFMLFVSNLKLFPISFFVVAHHQYKAVAEEQHDLIGQMFGWLFG